MKVQHFPLAGCLAFLLLSLWSSCGLDTSEPVSPDRIYPDLDLLYDANEDITYARAGFALGGPNGSLLQLGEGASITLNGEALVFNRALSIYELNRDGFEASGTFVYTDEEGREFTNSTTIVPIEFQDSVANIVAGEDYVLPWNGDGVADNEVVFLSLILNDPIYTDRLWTQDTVGATQIVVPRDLVSLPSIPVRLILDRSRANTSVEAPAVGGSVTSNYRPVIEEVSIVQ
ncbi:hypothetical protein [Lewinella sp. W8]|uniref:hypothetical protein n=1 Tax=Lewinella sp. W8 TaxID=2528208 RepID=UPI001067FB5B|nr:hypothetical protein [Lewinella sp. W8]MTB50103.1 hypothetical protein [Lewinella sp. W8]